MLIYSDQSGGIALSGLSMSARVKLQNEASLLILQHNIFYGGGNIDTIMIMM